MDSFWPWLALAGLGALHGLNPACGWLQAAACGVHAGDGRQALRSLLPVALGHGLSVLLVALAVAAGSSIDGQWLQWPAGALLMLVLASFLHGKPRARHHARPGGSGSSGRADQHDPTSPNRSCAPANRAAIRCGRATQAGIALTAFIVSTAHGAGLMLVPALVPLCLSNSPARQITASGSLLLALAAVLVHMAAMLGVTALLACSACRLASPFTGRLGGLRQGLPSGGTTIGQLRRWLKG